MHANTPSNGLSRADFLKLSSLTACGLLTPPFLFSMGSINTDERSMRQHFAVARAIAHRPPAKFRGIAMPVGLQYLQLRTLVIAKLAEQVRKGKRLSRPELEEFIVSSIASTTTPSPVPSSSPDKGWFPNPIVAMVAMSMAFSSSMKFEPIEMDKTTLEILGVLASSATTVVNSKKAIVLSAMGAAMSLKAILGGKGDAVTLSSEQTLAIAQAVWNDPKAKKVITREVKDVLGDVFGIDYDATVAEHKNRLPEKLKRCADAYANTQQAGSVDQEQLTKTLTAALEQTMAKSVDEITALVAQQKAQKQAERQAIYDSREIQGAAYLTSALAIAFLSAPAAKVVKGLGSATVSTVTLINDIKNKLVGPLGAAAGFIGIIDSFLSLFMPSSQQQIMEALNKLGEAVYQMHQDMHAWFGVVVQNQQVILEGINAILKENIKTREELKALMAQQSDLIKLVIAEVRRDRRELAINYLKEHNGTVESVASLLQVTGRVDNADRGRIRTAMEAIYRFGNDTSVSGVFTNMPDRSMVVKDPRELATTLGSVDSVDYLVGMAPSIAYLVTGQTLPAPANPMALSLSLQSLAYAYAIFPDMAQYYQMGTQHHVRDLLQKITTTRQTLTTITSRDFVAKLVQMYRDAVGKLLSEVVDRAFAKAVADNKGTLDAFKLSRSIQLRAAGPASTIVRQGPSRRVGKTHNFPDVSDYAIMLSDFSRSPDNSPPFKVFSNHDTYLAEIAGEFEDYGWTGWHPTNAGARTLNFLDVLNIGAHFGIFAIDTTNVREVRYGVRSRPLPYRRNKMNFRESYSLSKITVPSDSGQIRYGTADAEGWKVGYVEVVSFGFEGKEKPFSGPGWAKHIQYYSENPGDGDKPLNQRIMSRNFIEAVEGRFRLYHDVRKAFLAELEASLVQPNAYLDALRQSLRYLAGLTEYVASGNLEVGTAIAKRFTIFDLKRMDLPGTKEIARTIFDVLAASYLYDEKFVSQRANNPIDICAYIKAEAGKLLQTNIGDYVATMFTRDINALNDQELDTGELMFTASAVFLKEWGVKFNF